MNKQELAAIKELGMTPEQFLSETYWLDHNVEARNRHKMSGDMEYDREQQALDQILAKPLIKGGGGGGGTGGSSDIGSYGRSISSTSYDLKDAYKKNTWSNPIDQN